MSIGPEERLARQILELAALTGWLVFRVENSTRLVRRRSGAMVRARNINAQGVGFPDLVLVHAKSRTTLFRELKANGKYPTPEQYAWKAALEAAGNDVAVWRPRDWDEIERTLTRKEAVV